jgi:hypothetical protein
MHEILASRVRTLYRVSRALTGGATTRLTYLPLTVSLAMLAVLA